MERPDALAPVLGSLYLSAMAARPKSRRKPPAEIAWTKNSDLPVRRPN
jgi:hypothetical protein